MLSVNQLSRSYGQFKAVDGVSFAVERGEIVGLLGHNGAGKTTIMKMLTGYLEPDTGSVSMNDTSLADDPISIQKDLGYLPENLPVYGEMVVADYLDYVAEMKQLGTSKSAEIKRVVAATEIADKLLAPIATLSRGYKQRVGVAQALLGNPKLLILDEPTNGLDPTQTEHMRNLIKAIAKEATVILSTHIMQEVDAICDRVLILSNGVLVVDEKLATLRQANHLLLETSLEQKDLSDLLGTQPDLAGIKIEQHRKLDDGIGQYQLTPGTAERRKALATLAKAVIEKGGELVGLQTARRDLETLFKEVSRQAGTPVASQKKGEKQDAA